MYLSNESRGMLHVRAILSRAATVGRSTGIEYAQATYGERVAYLVKTAVAAGGINSGQWGEHLASPEAAEFFGLVEQASVVGKLGLRPVPLNVRTLMVAAGANSYWVSAANPKPVTKIDLNGDTLRPLKIVSLLVLTQELIRAGNPRAEQTVRNDLIRALSEGIDTAFLDVGNSGVADEQPASVTNGVTPIASVGLAAADVAALIADFSGDLSVAAFVTDPVSAAGIALSRDPGGSFAFPDAGPRGGSILGMPLIVSRGSPRDSNGGQLALIDGGGIAYGAEGIRTVASREATLEMADDPSTGPIEQVSLFQTNSVGILSEVALNWEVVRPGSVSVVTGIDYEVAPS